MKNNKRILINFKELKDEYQKDPFIKNIINVYNEKIEELELIESQLKIEKNDSAQVKLLNKKLANILSRKINQLEVQKNNLQQEIEAQTKELIKAEKLAAIGELASRLAHDMRNPLSVIKGSHEIMKLSSPNTDEKTRKHYSRVDRAINRMSHQLDNVLDFVRIRPLELTNTSIDEILDSVLSSIKIPKDIRIEKKCENINFVCDPKRIEIVLNNLITNSIQAIEEKGKIKIKVIDQEDWILIEVEDDGLGIPEDVLTEIFDPLFTTKQFGTGLGLSSCKSVVEQHGGTISATNNPTTFTIKLPKMLPEKLEGINRRK